MDFIISNLSLNVEQIGLINSIVESNRKIITSHYMYGVNRVISYTTFILGEICNYINIKVNGIYVTEINLMLRKINVLKEKNRIIKNKI
jgi:hypothetical protein